MSFMYEDPVRDYDAWDRYTDEKETEWIESTPCCENCDEHIGEYESAVYVMGMWFCEKCIDDGKVYEKQYPTS